MKLEELTTDDVFQEWIENNKWIEWRNPQSVREAFILWGDYVKDKYLEFKIGEKKLKTESVAHESNRNKSKIS